MHIFYLLSSNLMKTKTDAALTSCFRFDSLDSFHFRQRKQICASRSEEHFFLLKWNRRHPILFLKNPAFRFWQFSPSLFRLNTVEALVRIS